MVTWLPYDAALKVPSVQSYDPATGRNQMGLLRLVSNGTVDTNTSLRMQYQSVESTTSDMDRIYAESYIRWSSTDKAANPGKRFATTMFVARADQFSPGVIPTPAQILALGSSLIVRRGTNYTESNYNPGGSDDFTHPMSGPRFNELQPNTKYWVLVLPIMWTPGNGASVANDKPLPGYPPNSVGRVVSVWTNRTPTAPTITSPSPGALVSPGASFNLSFTPEDPDKVSGGTSHYYTDLAGVQVQYAPRPTASSPNPVWTDLPISNVAGTAFGPGWAIRSSTALPSTSGSFLLLNNGTIPVRAGASTPVAGHGVLAGGDWQLRLRTFDFGHPLPATVRPLGLSRTAASLTADSYPAINTSPWSAPVNISIPSQVPPPIPLSPINSIAVGDSLPVTLTWLYRNSASPSLPQTSRTVQIREVGAALWTTVVSGASAAHSYTVSGYPATREFEWRVQVTDSSGVTSDWSAVGRFWVVPAPSSGDVRPVPSDTIDGATLGCGTHRVFVYRRGGLERVGEIKNISHLDYGRVRDDISTAGINVSGWDVDCGNLLAKLQCWAYEIVIFRNNGFSDDRVWEGPITLLTYEADQVTIHAKDVMAYAYRRIIKQAMNDSGKNTNAGSTVVERATRVLQNTFAPDDPNVLAYLSVQSRADDAKQYRSIPAYSRTAFEEIDDMASNSGLDYTAIGRSIILWGTKHRLGTLPEFRDEDLGSPPIVSEYGMSMANRYAVSDGNGVWGEATRLDVSGNDPIYGLVEMLSSSWASDSPEESGTYTQSGLATVIESFEGFAERSISDRYSPGSPVVVRVPDNTTLNPSALISFQQLVPGAVIPLRSVGTLRTVVASQKLDSVKVVEEAGVETISITLSPFSRDDASVGEGEA